MTGGSDPNRQLGQFHSAGDNSSNELRETIGNRGSRAAIPTKSNEATVACPDWIYTNRNRVERLWARLKEWRAIATRYEKTANSFLGALNLAAVLDWLKR
jgi:transposase